MTTPLDERKRPGKRILHRPGRRAAIGLACLIVCLIWGDIFVELRGERAALLSDAQHDVQSAARTLANETDRVIDEIDLALRHVGDRYASALRNGPAGQAELIGVLREMDTLVSDVQDVAMIDNKGRVVAISSGTGVGVDLSDREHVRIHLDTLSSRLHVGTPVLGRVSNVVIVPMTRPVRDAAGNLIGIAIATFAADALERSSRDLYLGPASAILLAHVNGTVISRVPDNDSAGGSFADRPLFARHIGAADSGVYMSPPQSDGEVRITGYQVLRDHGFVVAAAIHRDRLLAPWWKSVVTHAATGAILTLLLVGASLYLLRSFRAEETLRLAAERAEQAAVERTVRQQVLASISQYSVDAPTTAQFLERVVEVLRDAAGFDVISLLRGLSSGAQMIVVTSSGWRQPLDGTLFPTASDLTLTGHAYNTGGTVICQDFAKETRFRVHDLVSREDIRSGAAVAMHGFQGNVLGCLVAFRRQADAIEQDDVSFLEALGHLVAMHLGRVADSNLRSAVLDGVPALVAVLKESGEIVLVNQAWHSKATEHDLASSAGGVGANYLDVCRRAEERGLDDARRMHDGLVDVLSGDTARFEMEYACAGDWLQAIVAPIDLGLQRGAIVMHIDISERRMMEDKLEASQRMEAVGQLTGGVAHDFNNLLTVVMGNAELMVGQTDGQPHLQRGINAILTAAERATSLTDQLLSFSRRQHLEPTTVDLLTAFESLRGLLERTLRADIDLVTRLQPDCPDIFVDETQLQTALINLIMNARDAMPDGGTVTVSCEVAKRPQGWAGDDAFVRISVVDTGEGMAEDVAARVFEPFYTTKQVGMGTGLGLSMVHGFVMQSGGDIGVESQPGTGTTIWFDLPVSREPQGCKGPGVELVPDLDGTHEVLVVEDETGVRDLVRQVLESAGCRVHEATTASDALELLPTLPGVDLVLSDIIMPGDLSGYGLAAELRRHRPDLPVVLMSGYTDPRLMKRLQFYREDQQILRKPFGRDQLIAALSRAIAEHQSNP